MMADDAGLYLKVAGIAAAVVATVWLWGAVAGFVFGSGWQPIPAGSALGAVIRLPSELGDPRQAWPREVRGGLPGPMGFYAAAAIVLAGISAIAYGVAQGLQRHDGKAGLAELWDRGGTFVRFGGHGSVPFT